MVKRLFIILLFCSKNVLAHQDVISCSLSSRVTTCYDRMSSSDYYRAKYLHALLFHVDEKYFDNKYFLVIRAGVDNVSFLSSAQPGYEPYYLGIQNIHVDNIIGDGKESHYGSPFMITKETIRLFLLPPAINSKNALKLAYYAMHNYEDIKAHQKAIITATNLQDGNEYGRISGHIIRGYELINSVNKQYIKQILSSQYEVVDEYMNYKVYDWMLNPHDSGKVKFYIKNDSFYYYYSSNPVKEQNIFDGFSRAKDSISGLSENIIIGFPNYARVYSDKVDNYFLNIDDTLCYYFNYQQKSLVGPFKFPLIQEEILRPMSNSFISHIGENEIEIFLSCNIGSYKMIYDKQKQSFSLDSNSISPNTRIILQNIQADKELEAKRYVASRQYKMTNNTVLWLFCITILVIGSLSFIVLRK